MSVEWWPDVINKTLSQNTPQSSPGFRILPAFYIEIFRIVWSLRIFSCMWGHNGGVKLYVSITETLKQRCGEPRNIAPATTCQICSRLVWSEIWDIPTDPIWKVNCNVSPVVISQDEIVEKGHLLAGMLSQCSHHLEFSSLNFSQLQSSFHTTPSPVRLRERGRGSPGYSSFVFMV